MHYPRPRSEPTVFENYVHDILVDEQLVELSLWDTAGETLPASVLLPR
jgi:GTPase SAR1 family protein